jgi:hexosaminidase
MTKRLLVTYILLVLLTSANHSLTGQTRAEIHLVPRPDSLTLLQGTFRLAENSSIVADAGLTVRAEQLRAYLSPATGYLLSVVTKSAGRNTIGMKLDKRASSLGDEGYQIDITPRDVLITAFTPRGIFWGIQTLRQLFPKEILRQARVDSVDWRVPCLKIVDKPRFRWRGLMIDYSRTFWNKRITKKYVDALSYYKINKLHMHLTDDQGWRLEIGKYPKLTQVASRFDTVYHEPPEREGYYSKEDIRELVRYAEARNVELVPEIEMPGHALAILAAYPELSCTGEQISIHPYLKGPGIHNEILCPGKRATFEFLRNVLSEVIELFPSEYVHIGGDEVPRVRWKACPDCQRTMKDFSLKDESQLQSWFTKQIEGFLNSKGKKLICWDEVTEGGVGKTATVMFWRGMGDELLKVVGQGNDVILSPTSHCYFDYSYETTPTEKVYSFEPVSDKVGGAAGQRILGVQANFWSHIDRTEPQMDRQVFPRLLALAEVGWTEGRNRNWDDFSLRLKRQYKTLDLLDVYYSLYPRSQ